MTPSQGKTIFYHSSQQFPRLCCFVTLLPELKGRRLSAACRIPYAAVLLLKSSTWSDSSLWDALTATTQFRALACSSDTRTHCPKWSFRWGAAELAKRSSLQSAKCWHTSAEKQHKSLVTKKNTKFANNDHGWIKGHHSGRIFSTKQVTFYSRVKRCLVSFSKSVW